MPDRLGEEEALGCFRFDNRAAPLTADSVCPRHVTSSRG